MKKSLFRTGNTQSKLPVAAISVLTFGLFAAYSGMGMAAGPNLPSYYPDDYPELIENAKNEGGELVIYSNTAQHNWAPIFRAFQAKYPWVESISANNLDSDEVFQRVLSAQATGDTHMDLVVSNATNAWAEFAAKDNTVMAYDSPETAQLPDFAEILPSVYAISTDPMLMIYNTALMDQEPRGIAHLAEIVSSNPEKFQDLIEIRDPESSFGFTINNAYINANEDAWGAYEQILPLARPETSSGTMTEKLVIGEYMVGFLISGSAFPIVADSNGLVDYVYPENGTVVLPRGIAIADGAPHPATAKLFVDFVMSQEGQAAVAKGGLAAYRDGVDDSAPEIRTYQEIAEQIGEENMIFIGYEIIPQDTIDGFLDRFYAMMDR